MKVGCLWGVEEASAGHDGPSGGHVGGPEGPGGRARQRKSRQGRGPGLFGEGLTVKRRHVRLWSFTLVDRRASVALLAFIMNLSGLMYSSLITLLPSLLSSRIITPLGTPLCVRRGPAAPFRLLPVGRCSAPFRLGLVGTFPRPGGAGAAAYNGAGM